MLSFITYHEAEQNVSEFASQSDMVKARLFSQAYAYLKARYVRSYTDVTKVPDELKDACYEIIRGILANKLYQGKPQRLLSKTVSAQTGTSVSQTYSDSADPLNEYEQYIADLIKPYAKKLIARRVSRL